jgi:hypothetical protein
VCDQPRMGRPRSIAEVVAQERDCFRSAGHRAFHCNRACWTPAKGRLISSPKSPEK